MKIPVVVTLSGKLDIEMNGKPTAKEIKDLVIKEWNIDEGQIGQAFIVMADMITDDSILCKEDMVLNDKARENCMVRIALPLKAKDTIEM